MNQDQEATFHYLKWRDLYKDEKPYEIFMDLPPDLADAPRTNLIFEPSPKQTVHDARGQEDDFNLDTHGFTWIKHQFDGMEHLKKEEYIEEYYLPEMERFIKQEVDGADQVYIFDWRLRHSIDDESFLHRVIDLNSKVDPLRPARFPHVDQSIGGAISRAYYHLEQEAEQLLKGRYRIINIWRPLHTIQEWPLAAIDARTVQQTDLLTSDFVRRKYSGETYWVLYNKAHKWHYLSAQRPDEVAILKIYDSSRDVEAKFCVHSSFKLYENESELIRESLEVRAMVFTHIRENEKTNTKAADSTIE